MLHEHRCLSSQRYNFLKANHNRLGFNFLVSIVVYQVKDTIFWKQITTVLCILIECIVLFIKSKIQFFESKSQRVCVYCCICQRCLSSQRYNFLKANHNGQVFIDFNFSVVYQVKDTIFWKQITTSSARQYIRDALFIKSKIQFFESKSQRVRTQPAGTLRCLSSQRYNFLKANHN